MKKRKSKICSLSILSIQNNMLETIAVTKTYIGKKNRIVGGHSELSESFYKMSKTLSPFSKSQCIK